jgi:hypothetical protein
MKLGFHWLFALQGVATSKIPRIVMAAQTSRPIVAFLFGVLWDI